MRAPTRPNHRLFYGLLGAAFAVFIAVALAVGYFGPEAARADAPNASGAANQGDFPVAAGNLRGLTHDGTRYLAVANNGRGVWTFGSHTGPEDAVNQGGLPTDLRFITGMTHDGTRYLVVDAAVDQLWSFDSYTDPESAVNQGTFPAGLSAPRGITHDGTRYLVVDAADGELWSFDSYTDPESAVSQGTFPAGLGRATGLTYDGTRYLVADSTDSELWAFDSYTDPENAVMRGNFPAGIGFTAGLAWDSTRYLVVADTTLWTFVPSLSQVLNVRSTATERTSIALAWDTVDDATGYTVKWRAGDTGTFTLTTTTSTSHTFTGLAPGTAHQFVVYATGPDNSLGADSTLTPITTASRVCGAADITALGSLAVGSTTTRTIPDAGRVCDSYARPASKTRLFSFTVAAAAAPTITLSSVTHDPYLGLYENILSNGRVELATDDDSGGGNSARIRGVTLSASTTYYIDSTSSSATTTGELTLRIDVPQPQAVRMRLLEGSGFTPWVDFPGVLDASRATCPPAAFSTRTPS